MKKVKLIDVTGIKQVYNYPKHQKFVGDEISEEKTSI